MANEALFIDRYLITQIEPPTRGYIHKSLRDIYDESISEKAKETTLQILHGFNGILRCADFCTAVHWNKEGLLMTDVYKFYDIDKWPGNPNLDIFVYDGNKLEQGSGCEDSIIILGREAMWRRTVPFGVFRNEMVPYESISDILF